MTPSATQSKVSLHESLTARISADQGGGCCYGCQDTELVYENNQICFKSTNIFRRLFCCSCTNLQKNAQETAHATCIQAFTQYLNNHYDSDIVEEIQPISVQLDSIQSLHFSHAQTLIGLAELMKPRHLDVKQFIIWQNWHKEYLNIQKEKTKDPAVQRALSELAAGSLKEKPIHPTMQVLIKVKDRDMQNFQELMCRIFKYLPLEGISYEECLPLIDLAKAHFYQQSDTGVVNYLDAQQFILRLIVAKNGKIATPTTATTPQLKREIEGYQSSKELTKTQWIHLLSSKTPLMPVPKKPDEQKKTQEQQTTPPPAKHARQSSKFKISYTE